MQTGAAVNVGVPTNKVNKPTHFLAKHFPIDGRKDFYKWVIMTPKGIARDFEGKPMYFDSFELERAKSVLKAIKKVSKIR